MKSTKEKSMFNHIYDVTVKFEEVDMLRIVNNAVYFNYFEQARIKYAKDLGLLPNGGIESTETAFYMARNEINYLKVAKFEDNLRVYTRVSYIRHSSFGFEHIIENIDTKQVIAEGTGVLVYVNPMSKESINLPYDFYHKVKNFERDVGILNN